MIHQRLANEAAEKAGRELLDCIRNCLREEEWRDAYYEFCRIVKTAIEGYFLAAERMDGRIRPGGGKP